MIAANLNNVPSNYDLEFGNSGSINQDFDLSSDTITQNMLDNGITLDSTIEVQNGECNVTGCWGGQGNADTFTNKLTIKILKVMYLHLILILELMLQV